MSSPSYIVYNSAMATTAQPVKQPSGAAAIRTMMQLRPATGIILRPIAWGICGDASAAGTPGTVELIEVDVAATMTTAYAAVDIQKYTLNAIANTAGATGTPLNLSTTTSGFATGAVTEGSITASRMADIQQVSPTNQYMQQWPLSREFEVEPQKYLRVRVNFAVTVNLICWVIFEI